MFCAGQTNGDARYSSRGEEGSEIETHGVKKLESGNEGDDRQTRGANDAGHRLDLSEASRPSAAPLGRTGDMEGDQAQQATEHKGDNCNADQAWQLGVKEFLAVGDPLVQDLAHEAPFLEPAPAHRQQNIYIGETTKHAKTPLTRLDCAQGMAGPVIAFPKQPFSHGEFDELRA